MHETSADLVSLQDLLDRSAAAAGSHLRSILTPERRLTASEVSGRLTGMSLLALATVTADGRPLIGPVDGIFYRGAFYFGSSPDSVRFRHIRHRPQVSATHLPGEHLAVTVHGTAVAVDVQSGEQKGFRRTLLEVYVPRYGAEWESFSRLRTHLRTDRSSAHVHVPHGPPPTVRSRRRALRGRHPCHDGMWSPCRSSSSRSW